MSGHTCNPEDPYEDVLACPACAEEVRGKIAHYEANRKPAPDLIKRFKETERYPSLALAQDTAKLRGFVRDFEAETDPEAKARLMQAVINASTQLERTLRTDRTSELVVFSSDARTARPARKITDDEVREGKFKFP